MKKIICVMMLLILATSGYAYVFHGKGISMQPTIYETDRVYATDNIGELKIGNIYSFWYDNETDIRCHRLVGIEAEEGWTTLYRFQGDNAVSSEWVVKEMIISKIWAIRRNGHIRLLASRYN